MKVVLSVTLLAVLVGSAGSLLGIAQNGSPTSPAAYSPFVDQYMSQDYVTHGVKIEMLMPRLNAGDDTATFLVRNYVPDDPWFEGIIPVFSAEIIVNGCSHDMFFDPDQDVWTLVLPRGWSLGANSVKVIAYDSVQRQIYAAGADNIAMW
jgi:hypothetical protein